MLHDGLRQLSRSTNQLLSLARADAAASGAAGRQPADLAELAAQSVGKFIDRALRDGIDLGAELQPASAVANAALLDDLLGNLIDNALKYTPRGGHVTVGTGTAQGRAYIYVEDDGPGIPVADRQRVLQRYVRLPNSPGHGTGLGLAICDEIVRLHDAELQIDAGSGARGTRIRVLFT
jgi:two-component system sensor histidine kinase TctE